MTEKEQYIKFATTILLGLKIECEKFECCSTKCDFYINATGGCLLKQCPCDYDMIEIKKAVSKIIEKEGNFYE